MSISYKFTKFEVKEIKKRSERKTIPFWAQATSNLEFHSTKEQKIKEEMCKGAYQNSILVSVADTRTRFWSYTTKN